MGAGPSSWNGWHLLPRHQSVVRRVHSPAEPGSDHTPERARRLVPRHRRAGRHSQHRVRRAVPQRASSRGQDLRPEMEQESGRCRRQDVRAEPGAAPPEPGLLGAHQSAGLLRPRSGRSAGAVHVREQDQRARVPRGRLAGRADGRPLPRHAEQVHRVPTPLRRSDQRPAHRVAEPDNLRTNGGVPRPVRRAPHTVARWCPRGGERPRAAAVRREGRDAAAGSVHRDVVCPGACCVRSGPADPRAVRRGRRWRDAGLAVSPLHHELRFLARSGGRCDLLLSR